MDTSEQSDFEDEIVSIEAALAASVKRQSYLAVLTLLVLLLLVYMNVRDFLAGSEPQLVAPPLPPPVSEQTDAEITIAADLSEVLSQRLRDAEEAANASQLALEAARAHLQENQTQLDEARSQLAVTTTQLEENRNQLAESQTQLAAARQSQQSQQLASTADEELAILQQELLNLREEGSTRQQQYQLELTDAQRQLRDLLEQRNQLTQELEDLQDAIQVDASSEVAATAAPPSPANLPAADTVVPEELVRRVQPDFPRRAASRNIEGSCEVEFTVTTAGRVSDAFIVASDGQGVFDSACLDAINDFEYRPRTINSIPVEATGVRMTFRFAFN